VGFNPLKIYKSGLMRFWCSNNINKGIVDATK